MSQANCSLLEVARLSRGLSQKDAATKIGISQGKLSKAENQLQQLPEETMHTLAEAYDYPISLFEKEIPDSERRGFFFRRRVSIPQRPVDMILAQADIIRIVIDDFLSPVDMPEFVVGEYDLSEMTVQSVAQDVRRLFKIRSGPISDMHLLLENQGIVIIEYDFGVTKIDALSSYSRLGTPIIILNANMPTDRKRFSLAHELGHLVMHAKCGYTEETKEMELQANVFASEFLLPENEIKGSLYNVNIITLSEIKRRWKVSMAASLRKAHDLHCISDRRYNNLLIEFSRKGYNVKEPIDLPYEGPRLIDNIISLYKSELDYSDHELMTILSLNQNDYNKYFLKKGKVKIIDFSRIIGS